MPRKPPKRRPAKPRVQRQGAAPRPARFRAGLPPHKPRSGEDAPPPPAAAPPEATAPESKSPRGERLQKALASAGLGSRRECEQLIVEGRVEVDGQTVTELGACVDRQRQEIRVDGEPLARPRLVYFAIHKPTGVVTTMRDPAGRPRVVDLLPPGSARAFPVGRLDLASEGLILATNDGELANQLTHPRHGVHKTYEVQVAGHPEPDVLAQLQRGVHLSEGYAHAVHVRLKSRLKRSSILEMVLDEGRNREVRRLLARVGHKVQRLVRVAVGPIRLGELPRGACRKLTAEEIRKLKAAIGTAERRTGGPAGTAKRPPRPAGRPARPGGRPPRRTPAGATPDGQQRRSIIGDGAAAARPAPRPGGAQRGKRPGRPPRPGGKPRKPPRPGSRKP